jgi:hypothetical protein
MTTLTRLSFYFVLTCSAFFVATAQPSPHRERALQNKPAAAGALTEHYEGTAIGNEQQPIPVTIDLTQAGGTFSGEITSTYGTFAISGGTRSGDTITIQFDVNGETGTVSGKLTDGRLVGTFAAGDQTGSVDVKRTGGSGNTAPPVKTPILILGVYHMDSPGLDEVNVQADDVLTPKRQQEIEGLINRIAQFHPTKIAIEAAYQDPYWPDLYRKYLAGQYNRGKNEIEQIAFPLAKRANLPTLYGIDFAMLANGETASALQISAAKNAAQTQKAPDALSPEEKLLRQSTVIQYLAYLNSTAEIRKGQEGYMNNLLPVDGPDIYKKADLVANWYKRNLRIFANINRITEPGKDRVLVIIGAGHVKLLGDFAADSAYFDLVDAVALLN